MADNEGPSETVLAETPERALKFLSALSNNPALRAILATKGYTDEEHRRGFALLFKASGYNGGAPAPLPMSNEARQAMLELDAWDEPNFRIIRAALEYRHPEQHKFLFQRIFVQSNASPHTAPPGHSALTFEISHSKYKPLPVRGKRALIDACVEGLKRTDLWREGDEVVFEQVLGMPHAYIPFTPERTASLQVINAYLHELGVHPIGRFGEWKYVNQDGAILSAKRVVESLAERVPDCVVLDLQMPRMTGVELQQRLLELDDPPPVIIITAHDEPKTRERCLALGAVRYLRKPFEGDVLLDSIDAAVRAKRKPRPA